MVFWTKEDEDREIAALRKSLIVRLVVLRDSQRQVDVEVRRDDDEVRPLIFRNRAVCHKPFQRVYSQ